MVRQRVRIRFSKSGNLKYIGHKDLMRSFESLFRRARLPLAMSGGFHPKMRMSLPSALALGIEGFDEVLELELDESADPVDPVALLAALNRCTVAGLEFLTARPLGEKETKAKVLSFLFEMTFPETVRKETAVRIAALMREESVLVEKSSGKSVDLRAALLGIRFSESTGLCEVELARQDGPEAGLREFLAFLGLEKELFRTVFPRRTRCRLADD